MGPVRQNPFQRTVRYGWIKMKLGMQVGLGPGHNVLDGTHLPLPAQRGTAPNFGPYLLWPNGLMDQDATWYEGRPRPRRLCVRWGPRAPSRKRWRCLPIFGPMSIVAKQLDGSRWHLAWRWVSAQATLSDRDPAPQKRDTSPSFWPMSVVAKWLDGSDVVPC